MYTGLLCCHDCPLQAPPHEQSDHLRARQATADILREANVPVTELRAGIIVGAGSAAFEVMRDMVYNLPADDVQSV